MLLIIACCAAVAAAAPFSPSSGLSSLPSPLAGEGKGEGIEAFPSMPGFEKEGRIVEGYNLVWGENVGWVNLRARRADLRIGSNVLAGWIWLENCGWVCVGDGNLLDGKRYSNRSRRDWGINNDGRGNLSGYAWSEVTGWISFSSSHSRVYLDEAGRFCGYAWGENVGWIQFGPGGTVKYLAKADPGPWKEIGTEAGGRLAGNGGADETFVGGGRVPVCGLNRSNERYDGNAGILCVRTVNGNGLYGYLRVFEKPVYIDVGKGCSYIRGPPMAVREYGRVGV